MFAGLYSIFCISGLTCRLLEFRVTGILLFCTTLVNIKVVAMDISLTCCIHVETLNHQMETIKCERITNANVSLWRNEFREIVLSITNVKSPKCLKYTLQNVKIHSKFIKEGKSSITLVNHNARLLISNCPPGSLKKFFQVLSVKLYNFKKQIVSDRKKLTSCLPKTLDEISPLTAKDIDAVNKHKEASILPIPDADTNTKKRRQPLSNQTNMSSTLSNASQSTKRRKIELSLDSLNSDQKHVVSLVKHGKSVFFTGSAGTGKSYLLRHLIGLLPPSETVVTASTGVAACHIGGMTLHSFAGIHDVGPLKILVDRIQKQQAILKQWKSCQHLIIDEISMIDAELFDCLEAIARSLKCNDKPFGGIRLIVSGDFFQLPPVAKASDKKQYCFQAKSWRKCISDSWELQNIYRQTDSTFINLLQEIRLGRCTPKTVAILKKTQSNKLNRNGIIPTKLCTHVEDVRQINKSELDKLTGKSIQFSAQDSDDYFTPTIDKLLPETKVLNLKVGCQVMLTKNINVSKKLVNGARGVIVAFTNTLKPLPVVNFLCGISCAVQFDNYLIKSSSETTMIRKQLPLKLAWAISIHKSQGMSLDCVEMSLSRVFEKGQAYVALSRATSLAGLRVLSFDSSCVCSSVDVLRFYRELRQRQRQHRYTEPSLLMRESY